MKSIKFITFVGLSMMFFSGFCIAQDTTSDKHIIKTLKEFYVSYISENSKMPVNLKNINSIRLKYCTKTLIKKIENQELDYDLILNAQDCDLEWLKTLSVKRKTTKANIFLVSYVDNYSKKRNTISLVVVKENGIYKVNSIF